jgi:hypothetical protein
LFAHAVFSDSFSIMIRNARRRRVLFVAVIALVALMTAPIDECDDYAFIHAGAASAQADVPAGDPDGSAHQHVCSCIVCVLATDDVFVPGLPAPQRGGVVAAVPAVRCPDPYLPGIFHPPIA